uniref:Dermatopontin-like n=1 Tax=Crassostrea virginica TaxID=6565 RepID=A0A8B8BX82_CRAVI|nr:dermatopontin-like [Crassostrea virginica]
MNNIVFIFLLSFIHFGAFKPYWDNTYDGHFRFECPSGRYLTGVESIFSAYYHDRIFKFRCDFELDPSTQVSSCYWTDYVTGMDQPIVFQCGSGIMHGIESYHEDFYEDRKFKFQCCNLPYTCENNCHYSGWVNNFTEYFNYNTSRAHFIRGIVSFHDNVPEDRKFDFEVCSVTSNCNEHHPPTGQGIVTITIPSAPATTSQQRHSTGLSHLVIG